MAAAAERLSEIERLIAGAAGDADGPPGLDAWLESGVHALLRRIESAYDTLDLRDVTEATYVALPTLLKRYYARGGVPGRATSRLAAAWVRLLSPVTPHLAEELGRGGSNGLVATASFPSPTEFARSPEAERREEDLARVEEDLRAVAHLSAERKELSLDEVTFYVAAPWKRLVEEWIRDTLTPTEPIPIRAVMERAAGHPEVARVPKGDPEVRLPGRSARAIGTRTGNPHRRTRDPPCSRGIPRPTFRFRRARRARRSGRRAARPDEPARTGATGAARVLPSAPGRPLAAGCVRPPGRGAQPEREELRGRGFAAPRKFMYIRDGVGWRLTTRYFAVFLSE